MDTPTDESEGSIVVSNDVEGDDRKEAKAVMSSPDSLAYEVPGAAWVASHRREGRGQASGVALREEVDGEARRGMEEATVARPRRGITRATAGSTAIARHSAEAARSDFGADILAVAVSKAE